MSIITFVTDNWSAAIAVLAFALGIIGVVVKATPSKTDDEILAIVEAALDKFGIDPATVPGSTVAAVATSAATAAAK